MAGALRVVNPFPAGIRTQTPGPSKIVPSRHLSVTRPLAWGGIPAPPGPPVTMAQQQVAVGGTGSGQNPTQPIAASTSPTSSSCSCGCH